MGLLREQEHASKNIRSPSRRAVMEALRAAQKQPTISQQKIAKRLNRPESSVSAYESGEWLIGVLEFLRLAKPIEIHVREWSGA